MFLKKYYFDTDFNIGFNSVIKKYMFSVRIIVRNSLRNKNVDRGETPTIGENFWCKTCEPSLVFSDLILGISNISFDSMQWMNKMWV